MGIPMIRVPSTCGWKVSWFTGEEKVVTFKNGKQKAFKVAKHFYSKSKSEADAKAEELEKQGIKPSVTECIW